MRVTFSWLSVVLVFAATIAVGLAGAQTPKTPEAVTANTSPVSENIDARESAARARGCGNGVCSGTETCSTCPADCGVCPPVCGDHTCNGSETCSTCPTDCGVCPPVCGDGTCNGNEGCGTCPADCGVCYCGNGFCDSPAETCSTCPADCLCGPICDNGACEFPEDCATCPVDCGSCTTAAPVAIVSFEAVFAGGAHTCALTSVGAAYCWGRGESGQLGVPPPSSTCLTDAGPFSCSMVPVPVGGGLTFVKLAGGGAHTCGLRSDGTAYCWGNNTYGQLGDNSTTSRNAPVPVLTGLKFDSIDAGAAHTCAVTKDAGAAYCWGRNDRGQLGDGTTTNSAVPVAVAGGLTFQLIAAGGFSIGHTCGLTDLGAAHCWGDNERGQLGTGTTDPDPHALPEPVSSGLVFKGLTAGLGRHSCALTDLGAAYCWGENTFGALGNRSRKDSAVPVAVVGNLSFDQLIAGGFIGHTCGVIDGAAYCWGENEKGQVGDGTTRDRLAPKAVAGGLEFPTVDAGFRHTCGRASTGTVYCWGSSGAGQLGNNSNSLSTVPAKVVGQP